MVDFNIFDSILDSIFVIDGGGKIIYCNDAAATLCQTSVRRVAGKVLLSDLMALEVPGLLPFNEQSQGRQSPSPFVETAFKLLKGDRSGKGQFAIRPIDSQHWLLSIRDVSLEEVLAAKYRQELAKTEEYARNLEKLVAERTAELAKVNQTLKAILNSLGQGFFTFGVDGECGDVFTKACEDILENVPKGRKAWEVLAVPTGEHEQFSKWMDSLFKELLPFEDMKVLGPGLYRHSQSRHVALDYYPIRREAGEISDVVVVATDKTAEHQAQLALEAERQYASMVVKYLKNKDQFLQFLKSARESIKSLFKIEDINEAFRVLHTLEGEAGTFSLRDLRANSRVCQQILEPYKGSKSLPEGARTEYMRSLMTMSEQFEAFAVANVQIFKIPDGPVSRTTEISVEALQMFLDKLRKSSVPITMVEQFQNEFLLTPVSALVSYYDDLIQSVAERLGKKVKPLLIEGGDFKIFADPYKKLFSSLVHAFRNAVDHGLESPDEREWASKDPQGQLKVGFSELADGYRMVISDDGKGIDPGIIREKMKAKYPDRDFTAQSDEEVIQLVSMPGFSSRESVGEFSGRGVGLDALREEVLKVGGQLHIKSIVGQGTAITLEFPRIRDQATLLRSA